MAVAFSIGAGIEHQTILGDMLGGTWGNLLDNGMLVGAAAAVAMTLFLNLTNPRKAAQLQSKLDISSLPEIDDFVRRAASRLGWNQESIDRLRSAAEETLISLMQTSDIRPVDQAPRLVIVARPTSGAMEMEFMAIFDEENLEDRLA